MAEKTLADPLTGGEIKEILLQKIKRHLDGDSMLQNDITYGGFSARFDINITFRGYPVRQTLVWGAQEQHVEGAEGDVASTVITETHTSTAPDVERTEHGLPVPVIVQTPNGPVRQRVHIERQGKAK